MLKIMRFFFAAIVAVFAAYVGAQSNASSFYIKHVFAQLTAKGSVLDRLSRFLVAAAMTAFTALISGTSAKAQGTAITRSVPSGPASDQVLRLSRRVAVNMALRYNLGAIESGENTQFARGQRLLALSNALKFREAKERIPPAATRLSSVLTQARCSA